MGYYVRVFCTGAAVPSIRAVLAALRESGVILAPVDDGSFSPHSIDWNECQLLYDKARQPIVIACNRIADEDTLAQDERDEFLNELANLQASPATSQIVEHLKSTSFIVCSQLLSDINDAGYEANSMFLQYFEAHCGGMIQADGEGFYRGTTLILPLTQ